MLRKTPSPIPHLRRLLAGINRRTMLTRIAPLSLFSLLTSPAQAENRPGPPIASENNPTSELMIFYDASNGQAATGHLNALGGYIPLQNFPVHMFKAGWSHIVGSNGLLFFYDRDTGEAAVGRLTSEGRFLSLKSYPASSFKAGWDIILSVNGLLLFYEQSSGQAAAGRLNSFYHEAK